MSEAAGVVGRGFGLSFVIELTAAGRKKKRTNM